MKILPPQIVAATFALLLALIYLILNRTLLRLSKRRLAQVEKNLPSDNFQDDTPLEQPDKVEKKRAQESVRLHFRNTKSLLGPGILFLIVVTGAIPFMSAVPATVLSVILGAATVTAGVAARPVAENFFAGLVMGFSKVLNIGDTVVFSGHYATVEDISITHTTLRIWDWRRFVIPNSKVLQSDFLNYSVVDTFQWAYVEFWVSYDTDLEAVKECGSDAARASKFFAGHDDPAFFVMETGKEGVRCWLAAWADTPSDAWMLQADVRAGLIKCFQQMNIQPHRYHFTTQASPN